MTDGTVDHIRETRLSLFHVCAILLSLVDDSRSEQHSMHGYFRGSVKWDQDRR